MVQVLTERPGKETRVAITGMVRAAAVVAVPGLPENRDSASARQMEAMALLIP
jgi:hypothetical protein